MADLKAYFSLGSCSSGCWLDNETILFLRIGPDGKSIVKKNLSSAAETVLYNTQENIRGIIPDQKTGDIYFGRDMGGNENVQLYRIKKGGEAVDITGDPTTVYQPAGVAGGLFIAASNSRKKSSFDLVSINPETGEKKIIVENQDNYNMPAALSNDGRYLLYNKLKSGADNALWLADTLTGETKMAPEWDKPQNSSSPAWKADNSGFYFLSDRDSDFSYVAYYDMKDGSWQKLLTFDKEAESLALSSDDRYLAVSLNDDGYSQLYIYDLCDKAFVAAANPPKGVYPGYGRMSWSPEGHCLLLPVSGASRPQNMWVLDVDGDSLCKVTSCHEAGLTRSDFCEPTLGSFKSFDGLSVPYFLYTPKGKTGKLPVMIDIHGGPEGQSRPGTNGKELVQFMLSQGIAVAEPNVRGSTGYGKVYEHLDDVEKRLDSVADIESLVKHLVDEGIADSSKIGVMGGSYGGFMTLSCAARYPKLWCCAVCTVGMFNLVSFLENTSDYRRPHRESEYGSLANYREILYNVSPIAKVDDITGPLMIIHGQNDPRVPVSEAYQTKEYLAKRGVDVEMLIYPDEGHGLSKLKNKLECYPCVMEFVKKHMGLDE